MLRLLDAYAGLVARLPLAMAMQIHRWASLLALVRLRKFRAWTIRNLSLSDEVRRAWLRDAAWGVLMNRTVQALNRRQRADTFARLLDPIDWSPVDRIRARGLGVIVAVPHVGPPGIAPYVLTRWDPETLIVRRGLNRPSSDRNARSVLDEDTRSLVLMTAARRLRRGGAVFIAPDGSLGSRVIHSSAGKWPVAVRLGAAHLSNRTGAATVPMAATWRGNRIHVSFGTPIEPPSGLDPATWEQAWADRFAAWLGSFLEDSPRSLRPGHLHRLPPATSAAASRADFDAARAPGR